ncbi:MAG: TonB family protein [Bacteriovoracaceae bacterium]|nr:TonB family protein [Bacteroidota bacterium]
MKPLIVYCPIILCTLLAACSSSQSTADLTLPQLMYQHPLPAFPKALTTPFMRIPLEIHVSKDGSVLEVHIVNGSGVAEWDSATVASIRLWRYTPALAGEKPINIWLHQTAVVRFSEPLYMILAEIVCTRSEQADSAHQMLEQGENFADAVRIFSTSYSRTNEGRIGSVNIQSYPEAVRKILATLKMDTYTQPIVYGDRYVIFRRLSK